jgi:hypothetical protein
MRQHKLRLEDLAIESFSTTPTGSHRGTVKGHAEAEPGTIFSWCNTCDGFTCEYNHTCAPQLTCVMDTTCAPEYTCTPDCGGGSGTVVV